MTATTGTARSTIAGAGITTSMTVSAGITTTTMTTTTTMRTRCLRAGALKRQGSLPRRSWRARLARLRTKSASERC